MEQDTELIKKVLLQAEGKKQNLSEYPQEIINRTQDALLQQKYLECEYEKSGRSRIPLRDTIMITPKGGDLLKNL